MESRRVALAVSAGAIFALMLLPSAMGATYTGSLACLTGCGAGNTIGLAGPGSTGTATFWLHNSNAPTGTTFNYFVCPTGTGCTSASGSANGWKWTFTPASGTVAGGSPCEVGSVCEGNGIGSPSTLQLSLTAPTTINASNTQETLTIYACSQSGTEQKCDSQFTEVASLTVTATVPQFAFGVGAALVLGLGGLLVLRKKGLPQATPSTSVV